MLRMFYFSGTGNGRNAAYWMVEAPQDVLLAPIALGYYFVGRFFFAKSFVASAACDGCGACIDQCPVHALRLVRGRPFWSYRCESCMRCMNRCPKRAVETAHDSSAPSWSSSTPRCRSSFTPC